MKPSKPAKLDTFDWQKARERLARVNAAIESATNLSPERGHAVMEERTRALAEVPPRTPSAGEVLEVAIFQLANERYAVETRYIREVVRVHSSTPVPGAPNHLAGLINHRGDVLAVFDIREFFDLTERTSDDRARVLVLGEDRTGFGLLADTVGESVALRINTLHAPSSSISSMGRGFARGVTADGLIVLDGDRLLRDERLYVDHSEESEF
jgi:purine-binding chemotaxis protein CheW